jgi:hypothetical protein
MSEQSQSPGFPRRDGDGRVIGVFDLLAIVSAGLLVGVAGLALYDGVFALLGIGAFGAASGWLALILPMWLMVEEFRAWKGVTARGLVTIFAGLAAFALSGLAASVTTYLRPLGSGAVGALVATFTYAVIWYFGIRWVAHRFGGGKR